MVLLQFLQSADDNVPLNRTLVFTFSDPVDPATVGPTSIQIREGSTFGATIQGTFVTQGTRVLFRPRVPTLCDLSDAGLRPSSTYRVTVVGYPEEFAIRNESGTRLTETMTFTFTTLPEGAPGLLEDAFPGAGPTILSVTPGEVAGNPGANAAVPVRPAGGAPAKVVIRVSENVDPCSVNSNTVLFRQHERGDPVIANGVPAPNGNLSGFDPAVDSDPDPYSWGANNATVEPVPRSVPATIRLVQDAAATQIEIEPVFGEFPDNALLVVEISSGVQDFSGASLAAQSFSFTTENRPPQSACHAIEFDASTPIDLDQSTADVNTARAPGLAQGFLLFSGDGDNGPNVLQPSLPETPAAGCTTPRQQNDGQKDSFDPASDVLFDTGIANTCANDTDGSRAVVWEFQSFRIRSGVTVRIIGANPAIILVQGDILIESGGRLLVRGDNTGGAPQGRGQNVTATTSANGSTGGTGVAGGGGGGSSPSANGPTYEMRYGQPGAQGYYHGPGTQVAADVGLRPGTGGGHGNTSGLWQSQAACNRNLTSGGGGGHSVPGIDGTALGTGTAPFGLDLAPDGLGGAVYGHANGRMVLPEAGSGGGAGGELRPFTSNVGRGPGGAGGAGGGFVDLTSGGDIRIFGAVDAAGSAGGNGSTQPFNPNYSQQPGGGGGGGGSGGGIRLLSPQEIELGAQALVTAAGGAGGVGGDAQGGLPPRNHGGAGAIGRIVLEDADSLIVGLGPSNVNPGEGSAGFYRGTFDASRFQGGGLSPTAVSQPFYVGPWNPTYQVPTQASFVAGVPAVATRGPGSTAIVVEARAFPTLVDGSPDLTAPTGWYTLGHFRDSGIPDFPTWMPGQQPVDVPIPPDNVGVGISNLNGRPWFQFRIAFWLPPGIQTSDPGPYLDRWSLCFDYDQ